MEKVAVNEEQKELTQEEVQAKHMAELVINMQQAEMMAIQFKQATIGKPFTLRHLASVLRRNHHDVERMFNSLLPYGFLDVVSRHGGVPVYKIVLNKEKRIEAFDRLVDQYNHQIVYLQTLKDLVVQQIADENEMKKSQPVN